MKKKKKAPKPSPSSVLDSRNWVSESSARSPSESGSGSGSSGPSCEDCHIDFLRDEVEVAWAEGGTYPAASNLDPSGGGWDPDSWSLEVLNGDASISTADTNATIDSVTGYVTFGSVGQSLEITARVKRCVQCKKKMKVHVVQLSILRDGKDVTNKTTSAYAGEAVSLTGRVLPANRNGSDWQWNVPGDIVKDFRVSADNRTGQRIEYDVEAWHQKTFVLHWGDGNPAGKDKQMTLNATVDGKVLTAQTTVKVKRPNVVISVTVQDPRFIYKHETEQWVAETQVTYSRDQIATGGTATWVQLGILNTQILFRNGEPRDRYRPPTTPEGNQYQGLDECNFPYSADIAAEDYPSVGFNDQVLRLDFQYQMTMWLMWKAPKPGIVVPLGRCDWWYRGRLIPDEGNPKKPAWAYAPQADSGTPNYEPAYPQWQECLRAFP